MELAPHVINLLWNEEKAQKDHKKEHQDSHHNHNYDHSHNHDHSHSHDHGHDHSHCHPPLRESKYPMVPLVEAHSIIQSQSSALGSEVVEIEDCFGRVLFGDVFAKDPLPPFPASIKDGYAVQGSHPKGTRFTVSGENLAGNTNDNVIRSASEAVYVTTGAPVPKGGNAVIMIEQTEAVEGGIVITKDVKENQEIRPIGVDIKEGECVLKDKTCVGCGEVAVLAACGYDKVNVFKQPVVGLLSTGDEVSDVRNKELAKSCIRDSNRPMLLTKCRSLGIPCIDGGIVGDNPELIASKISNLLDKVDLLVTSGGVSMGNADFLKDIVLKFPKSKIHFGRLKMKPGKPCVFATIDEWGKQGNKKWLLMLPGNPASSFVCFHAFAVPLIKKLSGFAYPEHVVVEAIITHDIVLDSERVELARAILEYKEGSYRATVTGVQQSSRTTSLAGANCLLELPCREGVLSSGSKVKAILI